MGQMEIAASSLSTKLQGSDHQNFATLIQKIDDSESHGVSVGVTQLIEITKKRLEISYAEHYCLWINWIDSRYGSLLCVGWFSG